ncbi:hypothetical protein AB5N19_12257 [Seiridium cardinale]|uniref:Uncharacterized protein n=1 Tax=Seiridium cardinale TaxID=138064 RepID=A0ABR2XTS8_9PEZI
MAPAKKSTWSNIKPFIEMMRVSNPVGSILVYFPHLIGSLFAACCASSSNEVSITKIISTNSILLLGSALLHATGCSWNDIVDADLDRLVARTKNRPIPRGAITMQQAYLFTAAETVTWLCMLWMLTPRLVVWGIPMIILVGVYPYAKRFTNFPSVFLGCVLAYGLFLGCVSVDVDPLEILLRGSPSTLVAATCLFMTYTLICTSVDMIYAHQDLPDDLKAGIRSMAVTFQGYPKPVLFTFAALQLGLLVYAGRLMEFSDIYMSMAGAGVTLANVWMIWSVDLGSSQECWWWFQYGSMMMGSILSLAMLAEYLRGADSPATIAGLQLHAGYTYLQTLSPRK